MSAAPAAADGFAWRPRHDADGVWDRCLGPVAVSVHEGPAGWRVEVSHGPTPQELFLDEKAAKFAADRVARAQLERTLAALTDAEAAHPDRRPRNCGLVVLRAHESIPDKRREIMAALLAVS